LWAARSRTSRSGLMPTAPAGLISRSLAGVGPTSDPQVDNLEPAGPTLRPAQVGDDGIDLAAAETPRRRRPAEGRRTSSGASLRDLGGAAEDSGYGEGFPVSPKPHSWTSRYRCVETPQTLNDTSPQATGTAGRLRNGKVAPTAETPQTLNDTSAQATGTAGRLRNGKVAPVRTLGGPRQALPLLQERERG
jgi:hypothetical protein